MTNRLYYEQSYLKEFEAIITNIAQREGKQILAMDQSAFYPTSGGQPYDTGTIGASRVTDVFVDAAGEVWHEVEGAFEVGEQVHARIDWDRRFDHMQQHAGEHMIAGAVYRLCGGTTIGLHLGAESSSIDVELPGGETHLPQSMLDRIEDDVNAHIQQDHAIRCWFPGERELAELPLRKRPSVHEHVRIVVMGDFEMVACGGTHPSSTGQIGLVKIIDASPARGKLRLSFICGARAFNDYRKNYQYAWGAAKLLSTRPEKLQAGVEGLIARAKNAELELGRLRREKLLANLSQLIEAAQPCKDSARVICMELDADMDSAKELAAALIRHEGVIVLLAVKAGTSYNYIFARSAELTHNMGALLSQTAKPLGGKGGGRPDFAQGGGPIQVIYAARDSLMQ